ncbi:SEL1-like repeat protein [Ramlibacter sp. AW1]|uniref:SEL1-like repeat protein n=2 Tax=Ramlibacter aurantiacus TaxID=2801330 RepID=A0A936ZM53_9BURK|nr:SEL1-like repeat protein [Ramlibacter aurantiacus]
MRLSGVDVAQHRDIILKAMSSVTQEAGVRLFDVTDRPELPANLTIEVTPNQALEDNQPCVTVLNFRQETRIEAASVQMRSKDAWRCAHHEAMHVMGVRGHPAGHTVLSYFPTQVDALTPLDRTMLRGWYSPRMRGGMTPFEAMAVLADEWVATRPDRANASLVRDRFFASTFEQMQAFAAGQGDVPAVVRRSGKHTEDGIRWGRAEMGYFLGVAYLQGVSVPPDRTMAIQWFERAASAGNRRAQAQLGSFR